MDSPRKTAKRTGLMLVTTLLLAGVLPMAALPADAHASHKGIIMVLDYGLNNAGYNTIKNTLALAGFSECTGTAHPWNCYEMVKPSDYQLNSCAILSQAERRVLVVPSRPTLDAFGALYQCRTPLRNAMSSGLCLVAMEQINRGPDRYDWIAGGSYNSPKIPDYHEQHGDGVTITTPGESHIATSGLVFSNWAYTFHEYFTYSAANLPPSASVLAHIAGQSSKALIFSYPWGLGGGLVMSLHPDDHTPLGGGGPPDAVQLVKQSVEWGLECSCDKPHHRYDGYAPGEEGEVLGELVDAALDGAASSVNRILSPPLPTIDAAGLAYVTSDGAAYSESNAISGFQRWEEYAVYEEGLFLISPPADHRQL